MPGLAELVEGYLEQHRPDEETRLALAEILVEPAPFDRARPLHLTGSALVVDPAGARVLLRYHRHVGAWIQLGGHGDAGETDPFEVALRESGEECGLEDLIAFPDPTAPELAQAVVVTVRANDVEPAHRHLDLRYLLSTGRPERATPESADAPLRWVPLEQAFEVSGKDNLVPLFERVAVQLGSKSFG